MLKFPTGNVFNTTTDCTLNQADMGLFLLRLGRDTEGNHLFGGGGGHMIPQFVANAKAMEIIWHRLDAALRK